jgi:prepilin-type N-terminal cleavage/methylation domain-containing protein
MPSRLHYAPNPRWGFTLVELMVVLVILSILGSLMLAGLNVARARSRTEKTRGTLSKLNGVINAQFESYAERAHAPVRTGTAAPAAGTEFMYDVFLDTAATPPRFYGPREIGGAWPAASYPSKVPHGALAQRRLLVTVEMPDSWADVPDTVNDVRFSTTLPPFARTGTVRGYAAYKQTVTPTTNNGSAECLYMIVARSGFDPYAIEQFRNDEIGDTDNDGAPEFLDHRGRPIIFLRWAPGFTPYSAAQVADSANRHDPMDPHNVDTAAYALTPLLVSGGEDELTGLQVTANGWLPLSLTSIVTTGATIGAPDPANPTAFRDNITNHDAR